ncbi:MAG: DNA polymerase III subunit delta [Rhodobacter sp.]|nr:DNA polymerase III subunit delta [Rhodobacter sp.]
MKLKGRDAARHFAAPDQSATGTLIYGADAMRVALKRQELIANLIGPAGEEEMRLERLSGGDLRRDPALLDNAAKAQGFFPGPRVAFVEEASDTVAKHIAAALADWQPGDAQIVVTAGSLNAKSALRKAFESHRTAFAIGIYADPPSREEIEADLKKAGLRDISADAMADLTALARVIDPGDLRQTIEKLALYKLGDETPVSSADIEANAPLTTDAAIDDVLNIVAEARTSEIGPVMQKLTGQGIAPVGLCIGATRHFRILHAAASDPGGASAGIARARPPVFGPRRDRMVRQAQDWGLPRLEKALQMLTDTDLLLRSAAQRAPQMALVERTLIRLAMLAGVGR